MASRSSFLPWRYGMFLALLASIAPLSLIWPWHGAVMAGFDLAALTFMASVVPLISAKPETMRRNARANDANRELMLLLTGVVVLVILVAVGAALSQHGGPKASVVALLLVTLVIAWLFSNLIYAMHYAHDFYLAGANGKDGGGLEFPDTKEPDYWDFFYFAYTLGMTFQTSDVTIASRDMRRTALFHCMAGFLFNIGVLAFTINVLGGGA